MMQSRAVREYLSRPYARVLTPDEDTGTYTAEILEFSGCIAQGYTPQEAYRKLDAAAESWIEEVLRAGQEIPEPSDPYSCSGRIALRLPRGLHRRAALMAQRDGTSLNTFLVAAIAECVGGKRMWSLRSENDREDASRAAERLGELMGDKPGGGHRNAAGFTEVLRP